MMAQYALTAVIAILGSVMIVLLGVILSRLARMEEKLDLKQDKTECVKQVANCERVFQIDNFWEAFGKHSHTGLPGDSRVTR